LGTKIGNIPRLFALMLRIDSSLQCTPGIRIRARQHNPDIRIAASEGLLSSGLPTLGGECLVSGGKPTVFLSVLKVGK